ncbi:hypothetical protein LIA77_00986 [Sarocladium implicatum]|nr:hypothetical protein LIA77_00986 [Sarocladium implicatum]
MVTTRSRSKTPATDVPATPPEPKIRPGKGAMPTVKEPKAKRAPRAKAAREAKQAPKPANETKAAVRPSRAAKSTTASEIKSTGNASDNVSGSLPKSLENVATQEEIESSEEALPRMSTAGGEELGTWTGSNGVGAQLERLAEALKHLCPQSGRNDDQEIFAPFRSALTCLWDLQLRLRTLEVPEVTDSATSNLAASCVQKRRLSFMAAYLLNNGFDDLWAAVSHVQDPRCSLSTTQKKQLDYQRVYLLTWAEALDRAEPFPHHVSESSVDTAAIPIAQSEEGLRDFYIPGKPDQNRRFRRLKDGMTELPWLRQKLLLLWQDLNTVYCLVPASAGDEAAHGELLARCASIEHRLELRQVIFELLYQKICILSHKGDSVFDYHLESFATLDHQLEVLDIECQEAEQVIDDGTVALSNLRDTERELSLIEVDSEHCPIDDEDDRWSQSYLTCQPLLDEPESDEEVQLVGEPTFQTESSLQWWVHRFERWDTFSDVNGLVRDVVQLFDVIAEDLKLDKLEFLMASDIEFLMGCGQKSCRALKSALDANEFPPHTHHCRLPSVDIASGQGATPRQRSRDSEKESVWILSVHGNHPNWLRPATWGLSRAEVRRLAGIGVKLSKYLSLGRDSNISLGAEELQILWRILNALEEVDFPGWASMIASHWKLTPRQMNYHARPEIDVVHWKNCAATEREINARIASLLERTSSASSPEQKSSKKRKRHTKSVSPAKGDPTYVDNEEMEDRSDSDPELETVKSHDHQKAPTAKRRKHHPEARYVDEVTESESDEDLHDRLADGELENLRLLEDRSPERSPSSKRQTGDATYQPGPDSDSDSESDSDLDEGEDDLDLYETRESTSVRKGDQSDERLNKGVRFTDPTSPTGRKPSVSECNSSNLYPHVLGLLPDHDMGGQDSDGSRALTPASVYNTALAMHQLMVKLITLTWSNPSFTKEELERWMAAGHRRDTSELQDLVFTKADWIKAGGSYSLRPLRPREFRWLEDLIDPFVPSCVSPQRGLLAHLVSMRLRVLLGYLQSSKSPSHSGMEDLGEWMTVKRLREVINGDQMHISQKRLGPIIKYMLMTNELRCRESDDGIQWLYKLSDPRFRQPDRVLWWDLQNLPVEYRQLCDPPDSDGSDDCAMEDDSVVYPLPCWVKLNPEDAEKQPDTIDLNYRLTRNLFACLGYRFGNMLYHVERQLAVDFPSVRNSARPVSAGQSIGFYKNHLVQYELDGLTDRALRLLSLGKEEPLQESEPILPDLFAYRYPSFNDAWPAHRREVWWKNEAIDVNGMLEAIEAERLLHLPVHQDPLQNNDVLNSWKASWKSQLHSTKLKSTRTQQDITVEGSEAARATKGITVSRSEPNTNMRTLDRTKSAEDASVKKKREAEREALRKHILEQAKNWPSKEEDKSITFDQMHKDGVFFYHDAEDWFGGDPVQMKEWEEAAQADTDGKLTGLYGTYPSLDRRVKARSSVWAGSRPPPRSAAKDQPLTVPPLRLHAAGTYDSKPQQPEAVRSLSQEKPQRGAGGWASGIASFFGYFGRQKTDDGMARYLNLEVIEDETEAKVGESVTRLDAESAKVTDDTWSRELREETKEAIKQGRKRKQGSEAIAPVAVKRPRRTTARYR